MQTTVVHSTSDVQKRNSPLCVGGNSSLCAILALYSDQERRRKIIRHVVHQLLRDEKNCCAKEQANRGEDVRNNDPDASRHQYSGADEGENEKLGVVQRRSGRVNDACGT